MRQWIVIAAACCFGVAIASEPPPPRRLNTASEQKRNAADSKQDSASSNRAPAPLRAIVEIAPSATLQVETTDKGQKHHDYSSSEWWLVYLTGGLVVVTFGLAIYTAKLYRATVQLGEQAQEEASAQSENTSKALAISGLQADLMEKQKEIARLQYFAAHRPVVLLRYCALNFTSGTATAFTYSLHNTGAADCTLIATSFALWAKRKEQQSPREEDYGDITPASVNIPGGSWLRPRVDLPQGMSSETLSFRLVTKETSDDLHLLGFVRYRDGAGVVRQTNFLRKYDFDSGTFRHTNDAEYEWQD